MFNVQPSLSKHLFLNSSSNNKFASKSLHKLSGLVMHNNGSSIWVIKPQSTKFAIFPVLQFNYRVLVESILEVSQLVLEKPIFPREYFINTLSFS